MELCYSGSVHRFVGTGMAHSNFTNVIDVKEVGQCSNTAVSDTKIVINEIFDDKLSFSLFYFDKEERFTIKKGEEKEYKKEGNAFGFSFKFSLR